MGYCCRRKGWTIHEHRIFPEELREGVKTVLMARRRAEITYGDIRNPSHLANLIDSNANQSNNPLFPQDPLANDPSVAHLTPRPSGLPHRLISLPLHVLYHTLEFMVYSSTSTLPFEPVLLFCHFVMGRIGTGLKTFQGVLIRAPTIWKKRTRWHSENSMYSPT